MTRQIISIITFFFLCYSAIGQEYFKGKYIGFAGADDNLIEICGDTMVDGLRYEFVHHSIFYSDSTRFYRRFNEAIRKEGAKVFYKDLSRAESTEFLLYDYDLEVGESLIAGQLPDGSDYIVYTVDSIGTIDINGEIKKKIYVRDHDFEFAALEDGYIIEDIGLVWQSRHPFYFVGVGFDHTWMFSCYYKNEDLVFTNPEDFNFLDECPEGRPFEICEPNITSTNEHVDSKNLSIFPNPANDIVNIATDFNEYRIRVYNISGQLIQQAEDAVALDVAHLPDGMYFIGVEDKSSGQIQMGKVLKMDE